MATVKFREGNELVEADTRAALLIAHAGGDEERDCWILRATGSVEEFCRMGAVVISWLQKRGLWGATLRELEMTSLTRERHTIVGDD